MTLTPNTTTKRKPGRPKKQATPEASPEPNPFSASLASAREAYDSTKGQTRNPTLTVLDGGKANPESNTSKATRADTAKGLTASNASALASSDGAARQGPLLLPPFPLPRTRGNLTNPVAYVNSLPNELIEAWATSFVATGKREKWLIDVCPAIGRENNRFRADLIHALERHEVAELTIARLKQEEVMSDLDRRRKLKAIAESPEHPMKGWADNLKAIELDARHDPESCMSKASRAEASAALPPINLFFLPPNAARPMQVATATPVTLDIAGPSSPPPGGG